MSGRSLLKAAILAALLAMILNACSSASAGGGDITITASSGTLTAGAAGSWVLDAGYVISGTADVVTFTVTNSTSADFTATSTGFTNPDFSDSVQGTFSVSAGQSASFTATYTAPAQGTQESDTVTLTPGSGTPIAIKVQATIGSPAFLSVSWLDANFGAHPILTGPPTLYNGANTLTIDNLRTNISHTITLTGTPLVRISDDVDFTLDAPTPSATIAWGASTSFGIDSLSLNGYTTTVTISGQDSVAGAFYFTFTLDGPFIGQ